MWNRSGRNSPCHGNISCLSLTQFQPFSECVLGLKRCVCSITTLHTAKQFTPAFVQCVRELSCSLLSSHFCWWVWDVHASPSTETRQWIWWRYVGAAVIGETHRKLQWLVEFAEKLQCSDKIARLHRIHRDRDIATSWRGWFIN